jgi:gas vesicle protein
MRKQMRRTRFLTGALVGLAAGVLFAPKRGEDLRGDLADKVKSKFRRTARRSRELNDLRDILEDEIGGLSDDVRKRMLNILDENEQSAINIRRNIANELR